MRSKRRTWTKSPPSKSLFGMKIPANSAADFSIQPKTAGSENVKPDTSNTFVTRADPGLFSNSQKTSPLMFFQEIASALNLPRDNLSLALLAFTRFFSLTPNPVFLANLRQELLSLRKGFSLETAAQRLPFEAEAMAAVIAADKGVSLSPEALERYARYLLPPELIPQEPADGEESSQQRYEYPTAEELRKMAEGQQKKDELLAILNSLPGKNRHYWMVFPYTINVKGIELRIFIRILKKETQKDENEHMIVDISGPKMHWRCFFKKTDANITASLRVYPECSPRTLGFLKKNAEKHLKGMLVNLQNCDKIPSWVEDLFAEPLPSIDKEV